MSNCLARGTISGERTVAALNGIAVGQVMRLVRHTGRWMVWAIRSPVIGDGSDARLILMRSLDRHNGDIVAGDSEMMVEEDAEHYAWEWVNLECVYLPPTPAVAEIVAISSSRVPANA